MKPQYWTKEKLEEALNRSDLAAEVTLPIEQARELFELVTAHCYPSKNNMNDVVDRIVREETERVKTTLVGGAPVTSDHRDLKPSGQQKNYVVLSEADRKKGFVRPVRHTYIHTGKTPEMSGTVLIKASKDGCGGQTRMHNEIAETYARDPKFYDGTFCACCGKHFPLDQFRWEGTDDVVGS